jgi:hypothetical protein
MTAIAVSLFFAIFNFIDNVNRGIVTEYRMYKCQQVKPEGSTCVPLTNGTVVYTVKK